MRHRSESWDATLRKIARELTEKLRASNSVDWYVRESVRAKLRLMVKTILKKWKYPPDGQDAARRQCWSRRRSCLRLGLGSSAARTSARFLPLFVSHSRASRREMLTARLRKNSSLSLLVNRLLFHVDRSVAFVKIFPRDIEKLLG